MARETRDERRKRRAEAGTAPERAPRSAGQVALSVPEAAVPAPEPRKGHFLAESGLNQLKILTFVGSDGMVHEPRALMLDGYALTGIGCW